MTVIEGFLPFLKSFPQIFNLYPKRIECKYVYGCVIIEDTVSQPGRDRPVVNAKSFDYGLRNHDIAPSGHFSTS